MIMRINNIIIMIIIIIMMKNIIMIKNLIMIIMVIIKNYGDPNMRISGRKLK